MLRHHETGASARTCRSSRVRRALTAASMVTTCDGSGGPACTCLGSADADGHGLLHRCMSAGAVLAA